MKFPTPNEAGKTSDPVLDILQNTKTIAVVGLSSNPARPSYGVTKYMQAHGYRIIPVNPNETEVLGEKSYSRLEDIPEKIDLVNIFRRPQNVPAAVLSAIKIGAKAIWLQPGVVNPGAATQARQAGLNVVEDTCIMIEHRYRASKF